MQPATLPTCALKGIHAIELTPDLEPILQQFFEANPDYFLAVQGEPAGPREAHEELHGKLPPGFCFTKKWVIGYVDRHNNLVAMANVISDLLAPGVWHIGLFIVETSRHGTGDAQALYREIETWANDNGAQWLRLGVVQGNVRAERFWRALGYIETRTRSGVEMGKRTNTISVMFKAVVGGSLEQYLSLVERDRPDSL